MEECTIYGAAGSLEMSTFAPRKTILTRRLVLRDVVEEDAALLLDLDSDPEVVRYVGTPPTLDLAAYRDRIQSTFIPWQSHPWHGIRIALDAASGEFLGWVFVRPAPASRIAHIIGWTRSDEIEVGYRYHRTAWGRGIATEAAEVLVQAALADPATAAIVGCAHVENAGSLRVLEKLGLARSGEVILPETGELTIKFARHVERRAAPEKYS
jgi:RimJ/RimL family protein N-acetyltransferase